MKRSRRRASSSSKITADFGHPDWPRRYADFNGDGRADFCRVSRGQVKCLLASESGFSGAEAVSTLDTVAYALIDPRGSSFIDVNGDGNVDFCWISGPTSTAAGRLQCVLSNGDSWESGSVRVSPVNTVAKGDQYNRWWVDINGDGLPDYCRIDSVSSGTANGQGDSKGRFRCTLNHGDFWSPGVANFNSIFAATDVFVDNVNFGKGDGGRAFCDATGSGVQSLCRISYTETPQEKQCFEGYNGIECFTPVVGSHSLIVGLGDTATPSFGGPLQAYLPLLEKYSDGVGAETRITYLRGSSAQIYTRSSNVPASQLDRRNMIVQATSPLVYETRAYDSSGQPLTGHARYMYRDLRVDHLVGSKGFRHRWILNEGGNIMEHSVFFQGLPEDATRGSLVNDPREYGQVLCQERYVVKAPAAIDSGKRRTELLKATFDAAARAVPGSGDGCTAQTSNDFLSLYTAINTLGSPPRNPRFRYVSRSDTSSRDVASLSRALVPVSENDTLTTMDDFGNVTLLSQWTRDANGRTWNKTTTSSYKVGVFSSTTPPVLTNLDAPMFGRVVSAVVTATTPTVDQQLSGFPRGLAVPMSGVGVTTVPHQGPGATTVGTGGGGSTGGGGTGGATGWTQCSAEWGTCTLPAGSETYTVLFGQSTSSNFVTRTFAAGTAVKCDSATFGGDPASGFVKTCYYQPATSTGGGTGGTTASWTQCSAEWATCTLPAGSGTYTVLFGQSTSSNFVTRTFAAGTAVKCDSATFGGDPASGFVKTCYYQPATSTGGGTGGTTASWTQCSAEWATCTLPAGSGTYTVLFGQSTSTNFVTRTFAAGTAVKCDSATFGGDPASGIVKTCYYQPATATGGGTGGTTSWTQCVAEWATCTLPAGSGTYTVLFGQSTSSNFVTRAYAAGSAVKCDSATFGSDPAIGFVKACYYQPAP